MGRSLTGGATSASAHHLFRAHPLVELLGSHEAELERGLLERGPFLVRRLGDLRCLVIADVRVERVTSISDSRISLAIRSRSGSIPTAQLSLKLRQPSASNRTDCKKSWMMSA